LYFLLQNQTNVSETTRKAPLAEAQTTLGKQKIRSVERDKLLPHTKFH